jgi:hypothetical protein
MSWNSFLCPRVMGGRIEELHRGRERQLAVLIWEWGAGHFKFMGKC